MSSMRDEDGFPVPETAEHSIASGNDATLPPRPDTSSSASKRKNRSAVWDHFDIDPDSEKRAKCKYCGSLIKYTDGTSSMNAHLKRCKDNPNKEANKRQKTSSHSGVTSSPTYFKFDQEACRNELVKMFVCAELSFRFVEHEAFRRFTSVLQPKFCVPSRSTLSRDILGLYSIEREKLMKNLSKHCRRVCLTTDTWTSNQNLSYMCLTAHFIDNDWKLQKKILNFCQISGHSGEVMAKNVETCLNKWGLNRVFSLTVDNASSNDLGIQYLKKRLQSWNSLVLKGDYIHMRCCAHILNLIVKEGLKEIDSSIRRIRSAVKYVRSSPSRMTRFKGCVEQEKIQSKDLVCLDVETRWNSTYRMLDAALKHQKAFELLELQDSKYVADLRGERGNFVPLEDDWNDARSILPFLKIFYDSTIRVSGTSYITSNMYMKEVVHIGGKINKYCQSGDVDIRLMEKKMKEKFDKYWGNPSKVNMLLLIAVVLDPQCKLGYVKFNADIFFGTKHEEMMSTLSSCLRSLYEQYQRVEEGSQSDQQLIQLDVDSDDDDYHGVKHFQQSTGQKVDTKSELDKYLKEDCEPFSVELDVLDWWKTNSSRFPILADMAREVLAIPISTVASESAFSTGGRVLDPYRSSLAPKMVEALVCTQDWLKGEPFTMYSIEDFEQLGQFEKDLFSQTEIGGSESIIDD